jgi:hypothetical protein
MKFLSDKFLEGQNPLPIDINSMENIDWYNEQIDRCFDGYSHNGTRITGDYYWYLNFFPIVALKLDKYGNPTNKPDYFYPYVSQEDDYLFKQIEEADQANKNVMLVTARGYGKTFSSISIPAKYYYLQRYSDNILSSSQDDHISKSYNMLKMSMEELEKRHPTLRQKRLYDNDDVIESGEEIIENGDKKKSGNRSMIRKIVFDRKAGKTRGSRPTTHLYEEIGAWSGAAKLKDCYNASVGSYKRGSIWTCRVFFIGTGGEMKSGGSEDAKEMFWDPDPYNIYTVKEWHNRKTAIFIPAHFKYSGFWEQTGVSQKIEAKEFLEAERESKKGDKKAFEQFKQEYPFDPDEAFMVSGSNNFDQEKIIDQILNINHKVEYQKGSMCFLHWKYHDGKIVGVDIEKNPDGNVWILEEPEKNSKGELYNNLYVSGYDGIDIGAEDTQSGKGSRLALSVKKRMLSSNRTNNIYVCFLVERPEDITNSYEDCRKICWLYNCLINIEDTKRGIVGHFNRANEYHWFMKRPSITLGDPENAKTTLIGVTNAPRNYEYGELFLVKYTKTFIENLFFLEALEELRDFRMDMRTKFDIVVSMMMCEIADEDMIKQLVEVYADSDFEKPVQTIMGWYYDDHGNPCYGTMPGFKDQLFDNSEDRVVESVDLVKNEIYYVAN